MKTAGKIATKLNLTLAIAFGCLVASGLLWGGQKNYSQKVSDEKRSDRVNQQARDKDVFSKLSSTDVPADPGNRIVAIRRIRFFFDDLNRKRKIFRNQKDLIEIEVFSKVRVPVTNASQALFIGGKMFVEPPKSSDHHTIFVHLTPKEFARIKNGAIVYYVVGIPTSFPVNEEYRETEPKQIYGAKFGRIDKSLIKRFGVIKEDKEAQRLRISRTLNQVQ